MTLTWGIIGAGQIAERQMVSAMRETTGHELAAVMRRDRAGADAFAARHGVSRAYHRVEDLLADPAVNTVYIATPPVAHFDNVTLAAQAGKVILCEKPLARTVDEARAIVDVCQQHGVPLMVCYYQRYNARHQQIRQLVADGVIGQVTAVRVAFSDRYPPAPGAWRHDPSIGGGGPLLDLAPHCIDLVRFLVGPAIEVSALVDTLASDSPVEDTATLLLRLANGAQAVITTHWSTANFDPQGQNTVEIWGTRGSIHAAPINSKDSSGVTHVWTEAGERVFEIPVGGPRTHVALLQALGEAVTAGVPMPIPGEDGLAGMQVIEAAYQSAQTGQRIGIRD
ncbi:MAG: Gfo/Idh/MocA family oxidoreductase [Anaerolineae bacterium]|nr:Gfo/Idh/MocA family oxidoreductase [Anaerolineae bacterium]